MRIRSWGQTYELAEFFKPGREQHYGEGELETIRRHAHETAEAFGRLMAYLIERRALTLEEAKGITGIYSGELVE